MYLVTQQDYHHGLVHTEVRQQHVVLHDVTGNLPEGAQVSGLTVDQDLPLHPRLSVDKDTSTYWSWTDPGLMLDWTQTGLDWFWIDPGLDPYWSWTGLELDWTYTDPGLILDWTDSGLILEWTHTYPGLDSYWSWTGFILDWTDTGVILDWTHTDPGQVLDWYWTGLLHVAFKGASTSNLFKCSTWVNVFNDCVPVGESQNSLTDVDVIVLWVQLCPLPVEGALTPHLVSTDSVCHFSSATSFLQ